MSDPADKIRGMDKDLGYSAEGLPDRQSSELSVPSTDTGTSGGGGERIGADRIGAVSDPADKIRGMDNDDHDPAPPAPEAASEAASEPAPEPASEPAVGAVLVPAEAPDSVPVTVPVRVQDLVDVPELAGVWEDQVAARAAEARVITGLLDYRDRIQAQVAGEHLFHRAAADKSAVHDAACMLGVADRTAVMILNDAGFIRDQLPKTWGRFTTGVVDLLRIRRIATAAAVLLPACPQVMAALDAEVCQIAAEKTAAEIKHWLDRRIPELDDQAYQQRAQEALARRYVRIEHLGDGTSYLEALLPTIEAAVIQKRLTTVAASMDIPQPADTDQDYPPASGSTCPVTGTETAAGTWIEGTGATGSESETAAGTDDGAVTVTTAEDDPTTATTGAGGGDGRTRAQREADLVSAWLRSGCSYGVAVDATICVLIPQTTLTGEGDQPAISADRSWAAPAAAARKLATDPHAEHHWYTAGARPNPSEADHDILTVVYQGRFAPKRLKDAIIFRDGVCQAPGCTTPAQRCDLDHQQPYAAGGETTGTNIWALCRRHHQMKSHGYLPVPAREPPPRHYTHAA